ncbi:pentapeptide repeat-containing protein [Chamaesiphon minutus]|uniref:Putative low-complexity protein n=1 Tax=Chamaesiphon minutus (strain ATCC 27169 / PCC 6605) TaxID=1173020 RepID=K9UH98_CHAP6|nr:pentapeptide repeat-containing protein [Chamaesiphon minutus]AFY93806.1 putative low-complexity protein [Chamaesiphon minutus PCC 6605]
MSELDKSSHNTQSADSIVDNDLPDLTIHGYQVSKKLSAHPDGSRITYLAKQSDSERLVVVKEWRKIDLEDSSIDYANYLPEIDRLQPIEHPHVAAYLNSFPTPTGFCAVRSYEPGVSLAELETLPPSDIKLVADAILNILNYLHHLTPPIVHQNIKPENIIVDTATELTICLVDFGLHLSTTTLKNSNNPSFTPANLPNIYSNPSFDLYSLGVSMICLLTGTSTSQAQHLCDTNYRLNFLHLLPADTDPHLIAWLKQMVESNYHPQYLHAFTGRPTPTNLTLEDAEPLGFKLPPPKRKISWLSWVIGIGTLCGGGLILRQAVFTDGDELSPAQIAKNQSIAREAEFASSDRGKLIREKRCLSCNLTNQNFVKANLSGAVVPQSSLNGVNFADANLTLAIFQDSDLSGANLSRANLQRAAFYGAKLLGANLAGANLSRAKLTYAKLNGASLRDANLTNADLKFAEFQQVDLRSANLTGADLSNADLSNSNLRNAILTNAKLDGVNLTGATMPDGSLHP